ncbi:unnamed protein product [Sphagnum jensenii]|uniref:Uncharacterized protein n=1 Tax=Sphagnum jensenii TaxID=128206 RepID=A0ABP1BKU8_9BRYO
MMQRRLSPSVAKLSLQNFSQQQQQQQRLLLTPSNDKRSKRRARSSLGGTAAEDFFVNGFLQDFSAAAAVAGGGSGTGGTSSSSSSQPEENKVEERPAAATDTAITPRERCSSQLAMEQWRTFLEQQQQNTTTSSCQPDSSSTAGEQQQCNRDFIRQEDTMELPVVTTTITATTMAENPSTVEESEMVMEMEKLGTSSFLLDADQKLEPNTNKTAAVAAFFSLHSVEELPPPTCKLQSSASLACKEEPSPAAASKLKLHSNIVFGGGASKSNLQKLNESTGGSGSGDGHCYDSCPIPPLRGQAFDRTSNIRDLFLKHGPQQQHDDERVYSSSELPSEANEDVRTSSAAAASHELFYLPSIPFYNLDRSESSRTLDDDAHEEKLSATTTTTDKSSDSSRWTSATLESPLSLPDPDQELGVSTTTTTTTTGPCINEKIFNPNTQKQHVPSVAEKVTEEQLTEAAFLSNLGFSKESMGCASSEDVHQTHASPTNRTNVFRSKSTGRRTVKPTAAVREDPASAVAYSDSEQEAKVIPASSAANHLPLDTQGGKIDKQDAGNNPVVVARKFKKIKRSQTPPKLPDTSAAGFPTRISTTMWSSLRLSSERPEGVVSLRRMNADQIKDLFGHSSIDSGVTPAVKSTTDSTQAKNNGMQSKTRLMDALSECQQKKADSTNPRLGLVQAMMTSNHVSKLAPLMAKSTFEGMATTLDNEKSQSIRQMLLVSPHQSLEEYHHHQGLSSISILGNPSFSSSQKDRLWEEQAEAYSSGGRGTPGHEDNNSNSSTATTFLAPPRPGTTVSGDVVFPSAASGSLRKALSDATVVPSTSDIYNENGKTHNGKKRGKKKGKSRTPLQSLLAEEIRGKDSKRNSINQSALSSSDANPCTKQLMLRIKGMASKSFSPKSHQQTTPPRSSFWSSCICFSPLK